MPERLVADFNKAIRDADIIELKPAYRFRSFGLFFPGVHIFNEIIYVPLPPVIPCKVEAGCINSDILYNYPPFEKLPYIQIAPHLLG